MPDSSAKIPPGWIVFVTVMIVVVAVVMCIVIFRNENSGAAAQAGTMSQSSGAPTTPPTDGSPTPGGIRALLKTLVRGKAQEPGGAKTPVELAGVLSLLLFLLLLAALWAATATHTVLVTDGLRFAVGVGGSALAALAIGLLMFQNIRVAASLPIVVLFIGVAAFPLGQTLTGTLGSTLIGWMASIIGVSAVAEGATQITDTIQRGKVARSVVETNSATDARSAALLQEAVFPSGRPQQGS